MLSNPIIQFLINVVTINGSYNWAYVRDYLFNSQILQGIVITLIMAVIAQSIGFLIGLLLYFMRRGRLGPIRWVANRYIWFFRGTPLLVQILFLDQLFPLLNISNPLDRSRLFFQLGFTIQVPLGSFVPALLALALNEGAYMSEIVRAGIDAIDTGQIEAGKSLGMTYGLAMRRVVLPQALRVIIPPLGNEFNSMLKSTSLAEVVGVTELLGVTDKSFGNPFGAVLEFLTIAAIWFLVLTSGWGFIQARIERRLNASNIEPTTKGKEEWWRRLFGARRGTTEAPEVAVAVGADRR
jgi:polar amino acid transport system permease protein